MTVGGVRVVFSAGNMTFFLLVILVEDASFHCFYFCCAQGKVRQLEDGNDLCKTIVTLALLLAQTPLPPLLHCHCIRTQSHLWIARKNKNNS